MTKEEFLTKELAGEVALIDIREPFEVRVVPSPERAINVPLSQLEAFASNDGLPKDKLLVTICQSGGRCGPANRFLSELGYQVDMIDGGLMAW